MPLINRNKELEFATTENEMVVCDFGAWLFSQIVREDGGRRTVNGRSHYHQSHGLEILQDFSSIRILWPVAVAGFML